jgi:hypothetical protein
MPRHAWQPGCASFSEWATYSAFGGQYLRVGRRYLSRWKLNLDPLDPLS